MNEFNAIKATNPKSDDAVRAKKTINTKNVGSIKNQTSLNSQTISINKKDKDLNIMGYNLAKECRICGQGIIIHHIDENPVICEECAGRLKKLLYGENNG